MEKTGTTGKITWDSFRQSIWSKKGAIRSEVKTGPQYGTDVSVVSLPNGVSLATASDPLSLIPTLGLAESAWLSVHLTANDLATTGYAPMYGQFVLNLPMWLSDSDFKTYWTHIHTYCKNIGLSITGGHTGRVSGQESTIVGGATFSLIAPSDGILTSDQAKAGQSIILTKGCALNSTAILAMSFPETVKNAVGQAGWQHLCEQFYQTSVLKDGITAHATGLVHAMHDVTEGGVLGAVIELSHASNCGAVVRYDALPISDEVQRLADRFGMDPARSIGAGAMLMTCELEHVAQISHALKLNDIDAYVIGETTTSPNEVRLIHDDNKIEELTHTGMADPYWNAYSQAIKKGWK